MTLQSNKSLYFLALVGFPVLSLVTAWALSAAIDDRVDWYLGEVLVGWTPAIVSLGLTVLVAARTHCGWKKGALLSLASPAAAYALLAVGLMVYWAVTDLFPIQ